LVVLVVDVEVLVVGMGVPAGGMVVGGVVVG
jgi:hypothetical protein